MASAVVFIKRLQSKIEQDYFLVVEEGMRHLTNAVLFFDALCFPWVIEYPGISLRFLTH